LVPVLEIKNLKIGLFDADGNFQRQILNGFDIDLYSGQKLALVGESGCGKTISALATVNLLPTAKMKITEGSICFEGRDLTKAHEKTWPDIRGKKISIIFQDPLSALNPLITVGEQVREALNSECGSINKTPIATTEVIRLFYEMGLPDPDRIYRQYPHQLSGGMCQRVGIAMALAASPGLLIADEPTTALDVTVQSQILQLLKKEIKTRKFSLLFITHNLRLVEGFCDRVAVIYAGQVVEEGKTLDVLTNPLHPYTETLIVSLLKTNKKTDNLKVNNGSDKTPNDVASGCSFATRCSKSNLDCFAQKPLLTLKNDGRKVRCFYPL